MRPEICDCFYPAPWARLLRVGRWRAVIDEVCEVVFFLSGRLGGGATSQGTSRRIGSELEMERGARLRLLLD